MLAANIPTKFQLAFAASAGSSYITYPIPSASQIGVTPGRASLFDGFPPLNMTPLEAGGVAPFGQDFNGLLKQITLWSQWQAMGGASVFDSAFSAAVGGYAQGATVASTTPGVKWTSLVDNNTNNPDVNPTGWQKGGIAVTGTSAAFLANIGPIIIQGGTVTDSVDTSSTVTFPTTFPTACLTFIAYNTGVVPIDFQIFMTVGVAPTTTTGLWCAYSAATQAPAVPARFNWLAFGF